MASPFNEVRYFVLQILKHQFSKGTHVQQQDIYRFYMDNLNHVNNWNLVDNSAPHIVGNYLLNREKDILDKLSKSSVQWYRRIAIVATWVFIKHMDFNKTLFLAERYLQDPEDLMHKSTGWMLREVGKKHPKTLLSFLDQHHSKMPRTMLRYALEKQTSKIKSLYM